MTGLDRSKSGNYRHGRSYEAEFNVWRLMVIRCTRENWPGWKWYGGRGIKVCERWLLSYDDFLADMGRRPSAEHSIDRINNEGDYEPANCRWATAVQQARNQRPNPNLRYLALNGRSQTFREWARELGVTHQALEQRLKAGWPIEKVLTSRKRGAVAKKTHGETI